MKLVLILSALLSNMAWVGCSRGGSDSPVIENEGGGPGINKTLILQLVNEVRTEGCDCGNETMPPVPALQWNDQLEAAAKAHSEDMNRNRYFSHTGSNDSNPGARITASGYTWRTYGENIANGPSNERAVVEGWLQSEPHCRNIMNGNFADMGVGRAGTYWTQVFGAK